MRVTYIYVINITIFFNLCQNWQVGKSHKVLWYSADDDQNKNVLVKQRQANSYQNVESTSYFSPHGSTNPTNFSDVHNAPGTIGHGNLPATEHSVVYFHDDTTNTTHTVNLEPAYTTFTSEYQNDIPSYIESGTRTDDDTNSASLLFSNNYFAGGFYGKTAFISAPTVQVDQDAQQSVSESLSGFKPTNNLGSGSSLSTMETEVRLEIVPTSKNIEKSPNKSSSAKTIIDSPLKSSLELHSDSSSYSSSHFDCTGLLGIA